jgi:hypothetical protein
MRRDLRRKLAVAALLASGGLPLGAAARAPDPAAPAERTACDLSAASPWIEKWFGAWELASRGILKLPDAAAPEVVFYDDTCVFTTSSVAAGGAPAVDGPPLHGVALPWRALPHGGSLTLPDGSTVPVQLMSFANSAPETGPFFVMAAPAYWVEKGHGQEPGLTGVFLHEFAHTRQVRGLLGVIGPIDAAWPYEKELDDDAVQTHFEGDPAYVAAYLEERDLLYRAADAPTDDEARTLATQALAKMRARQARWFTGEKAVFATLDGVFLSLEGVGQWTGYAWLAHPEGGRLERDAAITRMLGRRHRWTHEEGLALFLVIDRLLPGWPAVAFADPAPDALELLERAVRPPG